METTTSGAVPAEPVKQEVVSEIAAAGTVPAAEPAKEPEESVKAPTPAEPATPRKRSNPKPKKKERKMAEKAKNTEKRSGVALPEDVMKNVRKLRAQMELQSGEKTSPSDAIAYAVGKALK